MLFTDIVGSTERAAELGDRRWRSLLESHHRLVRAELGRLPVEAEKQAGMIRRMRLAAWMAVGLAAWTAWVGLDLGR